MISICYKVFSKKNLKSIRNWSFTALFIHILLVLIFVHSTEIFLELTHAEAESSNHCLEESRESLEEDFETPWLFRLFQKLKKFLVWMLNFSLSIIVYIAGVFKALLSTNSGMYALLVISSLILTFGLGILVSRVVIPWVIAQSSAFLTILASFFTKLGGILLKVFLLPLTLLGGVVNFFREFFSGLGFDFHIPRWGGPSSSTIGAKDSEFIPPKISAVEVVEHIESSASLSSNPQLPGRVFPDSQREIWMGSSSNSQDAISTMGVQGSSHKIFKIKDLKPSQPQNVYEIRNTAEVIQEKITGSHPVITEKSISRGLNPRGFSRVDFQNMENPAAGEITSTATPPVMNESPARIPVPSMPPGGPHPQSSGQTSDLLKNVPRFILDILKKMPK